jgi:hypothetical protein
MFVTGESLQAPPGTTSAGQQVRAVRLNGAPAGAGSQFGSLVRARRRVAGAHVPAW